MTTFKHDNIEDIQQAFDYPTPVGVDDDMTALLGVLASENRRLDLDIESLYDNRFIESATGRELEKLAFEVGVRRKTGESDEKLRKRVCGAYCAQASNGTFDEVADIVMRLVDADPIQVIINTPPDVSPGTVQIGIDGASIDESPLTIDEIKEILEQSTTAGRPIDIYITGTFAFDGDNAALEGFNEGTWSTSEV
jgi:hypothetical protein